jgi:hypothetical protein
MNDGNGFMAPPTICLNANEAEESIRYRRLCALAGRVPFASSAFASRGINPAAPAAEVIDALLRGSRRRYVHRWESSSDLCGWVDDAFLVATVRSSSVEATVFARGDDARARLDVLLERLHPFAAAPADDAGVWVRFATWQEGDVDLRAQRVECPALDAIRPNYPARTRAAIEALTGDAAPWEGGRLLLWSGPPGTGKTWALRALLRAWKDRFLPVFVHDPLEFAARPHYYLEVQSDTAENGGKPAKPLLFIFEDAADLVLPESRGAGDERVGKFLNLTDGLFGQGRRDLFVITFNEDVDSIDPAFLRPGRCRGMVRFPPFTREEADAWLSGRGLPSGAGGDMTLAELYETLHRAQAGNGAGAPHSPSGRGHGRIGFRGRVLRH